MCPFWLQRRNRRAFVTVQSIVPCSRGIFSVIPFRVGELLTKHIVKKHIVEKQLRAQFTLGDIIITDSTYTIVVPYTVRGAIGQQNIS